jgi:hypothetical protein
VSIAFWLKQSEDSQPYLYIASHDLDSANIPDGYGELIRLAKDMQNPSLSPFQVKLIPASNPLAIDALAIQQRYPARIATMYRGASLRGLSIDWAYIYPAPATASLAKAQFTSP